MSSLTERRIRNIEPPATGQLELREGRVEGLSLIVRASGGKTWRLRYRFRGVPKGIVLGKYPALDVSAARCLALEALRAAPGEQASRSVQFAVRASPVPEER